MHLENPLTNQNSKPQIRTPFDKHYGHADTIRRRAYPSHGITLKLQALLPALGNHRIHARRKRLEPRVSASRIHRQRLWQRATIPRRVDVYSSKLCDNGVVMSFQFDLGVSFRSPPSGTGTARTSLRIPTVFWSKGISFASMH